MLAAKVDDGEHEIIDGPDIPKFLAQFDAKVTTTVTYNSLFDNSILAWRYGFVPGTMIDAMGMARALWGHKLSRFSLAEVSKHLNLEDKGDAIVKVEGMTRAQIMHAGLWGEFCQYALRDNLNCEQVFLRAYPDFPPAERRLMDLVLRCTVEPRFHCDIPLLTAHLCEVRAAKEALLAEAGAVDKKIIMSTPKFKAALEGMGIEVAMKVSPTTGLETPAFAKTDPFMGELLEHTDPCVAAMAAARIGLKSTLEETRTEKLLSIAELPWPPVNLLELKARYALAQEFGDKAAAATVLREYQTNPMMPMPLRYGAAHTHRLGGDWGMNVQNMPTVRGSKGKSKLRLSLKAPPGCTVLTCDLGQIEARLCAWVCGEATLLNEFANKLDPYNQLASSIFGRPVNRKLIGTVDEIMGFIGKTGILGLGYGAGRDKFDTMVTSSARTMGVDISAIYNRAIGDRAVDVYRARYKMIPNGWARLDQIVQSVWLSGGHAVNFGPVTISHGCVLGPNGLCLNYDTPQTYVDEKGYNAFRYRYGKMWHKLYGAKFLENIVQFLARIIVMNAALRIRDRGRTTAQKYPDDYRFVLQAHDELVFIIHNDELDNAKQLIHSEMVRPPSWGLDIPLTADVGTGASYGEAK
jgi:DNA polymerase